MNKKAMFVTFTAGRTAGAIGAQVSAFVLPSVAVITVGGGPLLTAALAVVQWGAFPLLAIPIGTLVDKYTSRRVRMGVCADISQAFILASLPIVIILSQLFAWHLLVVASVIGIAAVLFDLSIMAEVNARFKDAEADRANSLISMSRNLGLLVGPFVGGILVQAVGPSPAMLLTSLFFVISAIGIYLSLGKKSGRLSDGALTIDRATVGAFEGLRYLWQERTLLAFAIFSGALNLGMQWIQANYFVFAYRELNASPFGVGLCFAAGATAGVFAAILAPRVLLRWGKYSPMALSGILTFIGWMALLATEINIWFGLATSSILVSSSLPVVFVAQAAARRELAPSELQGRVYASMTLIAFITVPLGYFAGGLIGEYVSVHAAIYSGLGVIAVGLSVGLYAIYRAKIHSETVISQVTRDLSAGPG